MSSWTPNLAAWVLVVAILSKSSTAAPQAASLVNALSPVSASGTSPRSAVVRLPQAPSPDLATSDDVPYPTLPANWNITANITNLLGTRLYGWIGCSPDDRTKIREAYDDFHFLADQPEITSGFTDGVLRPGIDWTDQAAKDYWGPTTGKNKVSDNDRNGIQSELVVPQNSLLEGMSPSYHTGSRSTAAAQPNPMEILMISVATGEPVINALGGRAPLVPIQMTPESSRTPTTISRAGMMTWSSADNFFALPDLDTAVVPGIRNGDKNLNQYDNRARVFFHEMTHLDYFTNRAPPPSTVGPPVDDLRTVYNSRGSKVESPVYGPQLAKVLANWHTNRGAFYTTRNADNYAWYAMTKYVWKLLGLNPFFKDQLPRWTFSSKHKTASSPEESRRSESY
ncbi:uncharacterized protein Z518_06560 [Rhinocladiella mackenziei CBS 650.93]|uniref:Lysine-specific metallo-endopeptidase domain-containing protein n=1 Tax=Rhinocladiella mackenziei CBS 650.93 TaxID=1442369 RepID=A0A0D2J2A1_9EURO|nr:uncharacterized protein Z518_06560 [Rhinocladiella mackenziei CBS 650.93]KIX03010.1 hypothetical protein Z518_06560 [Rhinocladiella mackenziei CBS 650.93]